jgi:hypothetical protein
MHVGDAGAEMNDDDGDKRPPDALGKLLGAARAGATFGASNFSDWTFDSLTPAEIEPVQQYLATEKHEFIVTEDGARLIVGSRQPTSIEYLHQIEKKIDALLPMLSAYRDTVAARKHNNPPEDLEVDGIPSDAIEDALATLTAVRSESRSETPDASVMAGAIGRLLRAGSVVTVWAGRKADLAVDTAIEASVKATVATGALSVLIGPSEIASGLKFIASMLLAWIQAYGPSATG